MWEKKGRKVRPNLDEESTKMLNLTVLQRTDPFVEEILMTSAHVTVYEFNVHLSQWGRKDVEGSLFVVKRNSQPRFQFIVMNRRNTDNLVENLLGDFEYEVQVPYLLYRNAAQEVNGIWFYNPRECEEIAILFSRILGAYSKVPTKSQVSLSKSEFEELEAVPSMTVMDGPLEPSPASSAPSVADPPDGSSFMNFFSSAMAIGSASNTAILGQPYQPSVVIHPVQPPLVITPAITAVQTLLPLSTSTPSMSLPQEPNHISGIANLVKPSTFFEPPQLMITPVSLSIPTGPPLHPPANLQRPYGAPLLQPFPPPTPPPSLTPSSAPSSNYGPIITREKVRDALTMLTQDNQFIDIIYRALLYEHQP